MPAINSIILSAYGRVASMRSCARRKRAAATISIALVIFSVFCTEPILRLMSLCVAMEGLALLGRGRQHRLFSRANVVGLEGLDCVMQHAGHFVRHVFLLTNLFQDRILFRTQVGTKVLIEISNVLHFD